MIKIENLVKAFGPKRAVDDISFTVERGEVLGFLGPNGAGKSTTMRMITGFMPPTAGKITVGGFDVEESPIEAKRLIGYLPENAASYPDMTVESFLKFAAELRGLDGAAKKKAVRRVVELEPRRIVYVSCNPTTLAPNAAQLAEAGYALKTVTPVDMFPQTPHIECVALLERG